MFVAPCICICSKLITSKTEQTQQKEVKLRNNNQITCVWVVFVKLQRAQSKSDLIASTEQPHTSQQLAIDDASYLANDRRLMVVQRRGVVLIRRHSKHASAALGDTATRGFQSIFAVNSAAVSLAIWSPPAFSDHRTITPAAAARQRRFAAQRRRSLKTNVTHGYLHDALISAAERRRHHRHVQQQQPRFIPVISTRQRDTPRRRHATTNVCRCNLQA